MEEKKRITTIDVGNKICAETGSFDYMLLGSGTDHNLGLPYGETSRTKGPGIIRAIRRSEKFEVTGSEAVEIERNHANQTLKSRREDMNKKGPYSYDTKYKKWWTSKEQIEPAGTQISID